MPVAAPVTAFALLAIPVDVIAKSTRPGPRHPTPADLDCAPPDASRSAGSTPDRPDHRPCHTA